MSRKYVAKQWLWLVGMAIKNGQFVALVGPAKQFKARKPVFFANFDVLTSA